MLPLRDDNPRRSFPIITVGIIAINAVAFFYELSVQAQGDAAFNAFLQQWAVVPSVLLANPLAGAPSLISSMFLHAGWLHLLGNMVFLWVFGDNIEETLGKGFYLIFYLGCGLAASAAQIAIDPTSGIPNLGASGAIAGVLGGYLVLFPQARVQTLVLWGWGRMVNIPALYLLGFWFVMQLCPGFLSIGTEGGGVAYFAHIGGFIAGGLVTLIIASARGLPTLLSGGGGSNIQPY